MVLGERREKEKDNLWEKAVRTVCTDGTEHNRKLFSRGLPALSDRVNLITLVQSNSEFSFSLPLSLSFDIDIIFINCRQTSLRLVFVCLFVRQSNNRINFCTNGAKLCVPAAIAGRVSDC